MAPLAAALALALAAPSTPAGERVVEEIVAVVRNPPSAPPRVVTLTKLVEEARVALVSRGATAAATGTLDRAVLRAALEWLLDQMLVADEAARLRIDEVPREDVLGELRRFRAHFAGIAQYERFLAANELTEEELLVTLARMVRVQRYVESRVGREARVDEDEVDRWLHDRGAEPSAVPAREAARAQLVEDRARAHVRELLSELRERAEIRVLERFGAEEPGAQALNAGEKAVRAQGQPDPAAPERAGGVGERRLRRRSPAGAEHSPTEIDDRGAQLLRAPRKEG